MSITLFRLMRLLMAASGLQAGDRMRGEMTFQHWRPKLRGLPAADKSQSRDRPWALHNSHGNHWGRRYPRLELIFSLASLGSGVKCNCLGWFPAGEGKGHGCAVWLVSQSRGDPQEGPGKGRSRRRSIPSPSQPLKVGGPLRQG